MKGGVAHLTGHGCEGIRAQFPIVQARLLSVLMSAWAPMAELVLSPEISGRSACALSITPNSTELENRRSSNGTTWT